MKRYYNKAIKLGNTQAMIDLGDYYCMIENNEELQMKYFTMAVDLGNPLGMEMMKEILGFKDYYELLSSWKGKSDYVELELDEMKLCRYIKRKMKINYILLVHYN